MEKITYKLDIFEGPLDVLLNLIQKHRLNIYDIEISKLLEQYLIFMEDAQRQNLELAGEFLEMAARLIYIKTAALLPKPEEAEHLKKELEGELIELSMCRLAARELAGRFVGGDIFVRQQMKTGIDKTYRLVHDSSVLTEAYHGISPKRVKPEINIENKINSVVKRKIVPVLTKAVHILRELYSTGEVSMDRLYDGVTDRSARVATFLAVLELTRFGRITISEDNTLILFNSEYAREERKKWKSKKNSEQ
ncbi:MAG: segregation/condensation protein A [Ruminococcus sp.]|nr:segregation/condensation protein A [Ruminococcus sp.]MDE6784476.1 segregation/condensation protein A [Ruminococcus sp.]